MSRHGHVLSFSADGEAVCIESGFRYQLTSKTDAKGETVEQVRCLDVGEDDPLPTHLATGKSDYGSFKE